METHNRHHQHSNPDSFEDMTPEEIELEEIKLALFPMETPKRHHNCKIRDSRHTVMISRQSHRLPVRPSQIHKAERKAEKEKRERVEQVIAGLGLSLLNKLVDALPKPNPAPSPFKSKEFENIIDAEFEDIIDDGDTKALVIKS